jgi:hypothetical protein
MRQYLELEPALFFPPSKNIVREGGDHRTFDELLTSGRSDKNEKRKIRSSFFRRDEKKILRKILRDKMRGLRRKRNVNDEDKKRRALALRLRVARLQGFHALRETRRFARRGFPVQRAAIGAAGESRFSGAQRGLRGGGIFFSDGLFDGFGRALNDGTARAIDRILAQALSCSLFRRNVRCHEICSKILFFAHFAARARLIRVCSLAVKGIKHNPRSDAQPPRAFAAMRRKATVPAI